MTPEEIKDNERFDKQIKEKMIKRLGKEEYDKQIKRYEELKLFRSQVKDVKKKF